MEKVVAYIRVSTEKQASQGVSLDAQREKVRAYAGLYDLDLVEIVEETGSSATLDRPGLQRALSMLEAGEAAALLVVKLDRLTRSVRDLDALISTFFASRYTLMSVVDQIDTRTATGRLVLNILASVSQWEREAIGERTAAAMAHMRERGEYTGGRAPYGYRVGESGRLEEDPAEQAVISVALEARAQGLSLRAVARSLAGAGFTTRTGRAFQATQIKRMISNGQKLAA